MLRCIAPSKPVFVKTLRFAAIFVLCALTVLPATAQKRVAHQMPSSRELVAVLAGQQATQDLAPLAATPCTGGFAGSYPCKNVDLMAFMPLAQIGGGQASDLWGWTDPLTGKEYALLGRSNGTAFVDISDPENPVYLGNLPTRTGSSSWRDVDVYRHYAFIVADQNGNHGMQVFDLWQLRDVQQPPVTFNETAHYSGFQNAHSIYVNKATGYAYAAGTNTCSGGLHTINIQKPKAPVSAGCYSGDGYTHEVQCVVYKGPDTAHQGAEICFASNEDTVTIVDVTNKNAPKLLSRTPYTGSGYTHQGWLSGNQRTFVVDDELDELEYGHGTWTRYFDVTDLEKPFVKSIYKSTNTAIDHNLYLKGKFIYEGNYRSGLRIIDRAAKTEVAYFDIYPADDAPQFSGAWGNYPFFNSGVVIVSGMEQGLFILKPTGLSACFVCGGLTDTE